MLPKRKNKNNLSATFFHLLSLIGPSVLHWVLVPIHFWTVLHYTPGSHPRKLKVMKVKMRAACWVSVVYWLQRCPHYPTWFYIYTLCNVTCNSSH